MAAHRYWRVLGHGGIGSFTGLAEIEMRETLGGPTVTTGGTASATKTVEPKFSEMYRKVILNYEALDVEVGTPDLHAGRADIKCTKKTFNAHAPASCLYRIRSPRIADFSDSNSPRINSCDARVLI